MLGRDPLGLVAPTLTRRRVLVVCFDPLTDAMAGPAIRAWHLAEVIAARHEVTLASTVAATLRHPHMDVHVVGDRDLGALVARADAVFAPTSVVRRHPVVVDAGKPLAIDMYIPTHLENLEPAGRSRRQHADDVAHQVATITEDLVAGDFFLCASERQRDFWIGALAPAGRVNPDVYADDPTLRRLIDVVPFGLPAEPPVPAGPVLRRRFDAIGPHDPVIVWGGGVYEWFDPLTLVRAVDRVRRSVPAVRLVFLGMRNPNPSIPEMGVARRLRALSGQLGLTGSHVFFNDEWVPYDQRGGYLLDADVAVSTHLDHVEARFSFRTRVLDYLWAARPMVLTAGDALSELVGARGLGITVAPGDVTSLEHALVRLLTEGLPGADFAAVSAGFRWPVVAAPLLAWCDESRVAPDRARRTMSP